MLGLIGRSSKLRELYDRVKIISTFALAFFRAKYLSFGENGLPAGIASSAFWQFERGVVRARSLGGVEPEAETPLNEYLAVCEDVESLVPAIDDAGAQEIPDSGIVSSKLSADWRGGDMTDEGPGGKSDMGRR